MNTLQQYIICPECGNVCKATLHPHSITHHIHKCEHCSYLILESEWTELKQPTINYGALVAVTVAIVLAIIAILLKAKEIDSIF